MTVRILITGSRNWTDRGAIGRAISDWLVERFGDPEPYELVTVVHGGARGADSIAADYARECHFEVETHPADWSQYGRSAGHRRNAEMVAAGADVCLAFPLGESRGTHGCMRLAAAAGIPVVTVPPGTSEPRSAPTGPHRARQ